MDEYTKEEIWDAFVQYVKWIGDCEGSYYENGPVVFKIVKDLDDSSEEELNQAPFIDLIRRDKNDK